MAALRPNIYKFAKKIPCRDIVLYNFWRRLYYKKKNRKWLMSSYYWGAMKKAPVGL